MPLVLDTCGRCGRPPTARRGSTFAWDRSLTCDNCCDEDTWWAYAQGVQWASSAHSFVLAAHEWNDKQDEVRS